MEFHHGQAHAVVGHRLVYFEFIGKRAAYLQVEIALIASGGYDGGGFFYYT